MGGSKVAVGMAVRVQHEAQSVVISCSVLLTSALRYCWYMATNPSSKFRRRFWSCDSNTGRGR